MIKKKIISAIALLLALISVVSCGPTTPVEIPGITTEGNGSDALSSEIVFDPSIPEGILLAGPQITSSCAIVYPAGSKAIKTAADNFAKYFTKLIPGSTFEVRNVNATITEEYQIVIKTDSALDCFYSIKLDGKSINVTGKDAKYALEALSYLKLTAFQTVISRSLRISIIPQAPPLPFLNIPPRIFIITKTSIHPFFSMTSPTRR